MTMKPKAARRRTPLGTGCLLALILCLFTLTACLFPSDPPLETDRQTETDRPPVTETLDTSAETLPGTEEAESNTLPVTDPATEAPTQPPTQPVTEPPTEAPTQPVTEPPTEAPTQPETEPSTEAPTECVHNFTAWTWDKAPTCTADGVQSRICTLCGHAESEPLPAEGHRPGPEEETYTPGTRLLSGQRVTRVSCTVCGRELSSVVTTVPGEPTDRDRLFELIRRGIEEEQTAINVLSERIPYDTDGCTMLAEVITDVSRSVSCFTYIDTRYSLTGSGGYIKNIRFTYLDTKEIRAAKRAETEARINEIIASAPAGAEPLELALYFHDYIVDHFEYDDSLRIYDLYGLLHTGRGVCQAYTLLYTELLTRCGIPATYAQSDELQHLWNIIAIDGQTYHVDVTWDDPSGDTAGRILHTYFLLTDEEMRRTHGQEWITTEVCTDTRFVGSPIHDAVYPKK